MFIHHIKHPINIRITQEPIQNRMESYKIPIKTNGVLHPITRKVQYGCNGSQTPMKFEVIRVLAPVKQVILLFSKVEDNELRNPK